MTHSGQPDALELKDMGGEVMVAGEAEGVECIIAVELLFEKSRPRQQSLTFSLGCYPVVQLATHLPFHKWLSCS